jgi:hypothetical protein
VREATMKLLSMSSPLQVCRTGELATHFAELPILQIDGGNLAMPGGVRITGGARKRGAKGTANFVGGGI